MEDFISRQEHKEFVQRMEDEHKRINRRMEILENVTNQIHELTLSVKEIAYSTKDIKEEQKAQGNRLEALEARDGEMWRKVTGYVITAVIGIVVGYIFNQFGM